MKLHKLKIGIDVDDVLFSCNQYAVDLANQEYHPNPPLSIEEITQWDPKGGREDLRLQYFKDENFFVNQPVLAGAKEFIHELSLRNVEIFIVTAIAPDFSGIRTKRVLEEFPEIRKENILLAARKDLVHVDVLFDDNPENCLKSPSAYPVLMRRPWNQNITGCLSVNRYEEFLALIDMILEPRKRNQEADHKFYVFIGPSASGKTSIIQKLKEQGLVKPLIPYTTREMRDGEIDGVHYHFISKEKFLKEKDEFFEHTTYAGNYYGSKLCDIQNGLKKNSMATAMDICGAIAIKNAFPDQTVLVYVDRPKKDLMLSILERNISNEDKVKRLISIGAEENNAVLCDIILNNHRDIEETIRSFEELSGIKKNDPLERFFEHLKEQEEKYGVEIILPRENIRDKDHLNCLWYGGEVGRIKHQNYQIVISAYGDIRLSGKINGEAIDFKDRNNTGRAYEEFGKKVDDALLQRLYESIDSDNFLIRENNNWFEVDLIGPDGEWIDLCNCDNVLSDDLMDCFEDVSEYFEYLNGR